MKRNLADYKIIDEYIGNVLKTKRLEQNIGLVEMAEKVGTYKQRYSNFETGFNSFPLDIYKEVCEILHVDAVKLFEEAQEYLKKETFK